MARKITLFLVLVHAGLRLMSPAAAAGPRPSTADFSPFDSDFRWTLERGWKAKEGRRLMETAEEDPETVGLLMETAQVAPALKVAGKILETHPDRVAETLEILLQNWNQIRWDQTKSYTDRLVELLHTAEAGLTGLPREARAAAALQCLYLGERLDQVSRTRDQEANRKAFIEEYAGTETAILVEIGLLENENEDPLGRVPELERIVSENPGTLVASRALFAKGWLLQRWAGQVGVEDTPERAVTALLEKGKIAKELESGGYPDCRWTREAPSLVTDGYVSELPTDRPEIEKMLAVYRDFLFRHFEPDETYPLGNGAVWILTGRMLPLFDLLGFSYRGVEQTLDELEAAAADPDAVRYLRTLCYIQQMRTPPALGGDPLLPRTVDSLTALSQDGSERWARKALSTLAGLHFLNGDYKAARDRFRDFVERYPGSEYAWVARLRVGQCREALGDLKDALVWYRRTEESAPSAFARVLALGHAAHCLEGLDRFEDALARYRDVLSNWDPDYSPTRYTSFVNSRGDVEQQLLDQGRVGKESTARRIEELERSLSLPGGSRIERGRYLLDQGRFAEARRVLEQLVLRGSFPKAVSEGRVLLHLARLETALDLGRVEGEHPDPAAAEAELLDIIEDRPDPAVSLAMMALGCLRLNEGKAAAAESLTAAGLGSWYEQQQTRLQQSEPSPLEREILELRKTLFQPEGEPTPYLIVDPEVQVTLSDGSLVFLNLERAIPGMENVIFANSRMLEMMSRIIDSLGGTRTAPPPSVMSVPNQPVGGSRDILDLWSGFFPCRPGHWMGWMFRSLPVIRSFEFLDESLTRAAVPVTVGYSGYTVILEKENGVWTVKKKVNHWIT